ncbi:MAG: hypothetical protein AAGL17_02785 [Cyanobacteria bacterium J06576_12]
MTLSGDEKGSQENPLYLVAVGSLWAKQDKVDVAIKFLVCHSDLGYNSLKKMKCMRTAGQKALENLGTIST